MHTPENCHSSRAATPAWAGCTGLQGDVLRMDVRSERRNWGDWCIDTGFDVLVLDSAKQHSSLRNPKQRHSNL